MFITDFLVKIVEVETLYKLYLNVTGIILRNPNKK